MNIAIDFITLYQPTGAGEYVRRIFFELVDYLEENHIKDKKLFALYDSTLGISYKDMSVDVIDKYGVQAIDVASYNTVAESLEAYCIDTFFIGCAQYLGNYGGLEDIKCRIICAIHDLSYEENYYNNIQPFLALNHPIFRQDYLNKPQGLSLLFKMKSPTMRYLRWYFTCRSNADWEKNLSKMDNVVRLLRGNQKSEIVTVSEYTKNSVVFNFDVDPAKVSVLYSPERKYGSIKNISNPKVKNLIEHKKRYYLIISAGRLEKNAYKAIKAFEKFANQHPDTYLVTVGYKEELFKNHIDLGFLNDSDLALCYANCYAFIYPSVFEGFGYPPIEAMHYGKPVLCSNVCSMPEVLESAPIYFSPMYISDMFYALNKLNDDNYNGYSVKSKNQYKRVRDRQEKDLKRLIRMIIS